MADPDETMSFDDVLRYELGEIRKRRQRVKRRRRSTADSNAVGDGSTPPPDPASTRGTGTSAGAGPAPGLAPDAPGLSPTAVTPFRSADEVADHLAALAMGLRRGIFRSNVPETAADFALALADLIPIRHETPSDEGRLIAGELQSATIRRQLAEAVKLEDLPKVRETLMGPLRAARAARSTPEVERNPPPNAAAGYHPDAD
jgi:hypothetical protein